MPKRGISHDDIARRLGLARSTITKILNQLPTNRASPETIRKVFDTAKEMGYDFHRLRNIHRRRSERRSVRMGVRLEFVRDGEPSALRGTAVLSDISKNGAQLTNVGLDGGSGLPVTPFLVKLVVTEPPLAGLSVVCEVIRLTSRDAVRLGINFVELAPADDRRLQEFLR